MIRLSSSLLMKGFTRPSNTVGLSRLLALAPFSTEIIGVPARTQSSVPYTFLSAFAIAISYADRSNLSTAIIPMAAAFHWDSLFSGLVLSAFWIGYALTQILGGRLADKYGGEKLLVSAMLMWSLCTALTPAAASLGNVQIIAIRVLLGAGEGLALPAIHSMIQKYVTATERVTSAAVVTAACFLGALLSNLLSPIIISQSGWEACFFYFAAIPPLIWLPLWAVFLSGQRTNLGSGVIGDNYEEVNLHDSANEEKEASPTQILTTNSVQSEPSSSTGIDTEHILGADSSEINFAAPVKIVDRVIGDEKLLLSTLLRSPPVWAIIAAQYGQSWGMIGLLSWLPTYFTQRFHVPLESLSSYTVLPYFLQMVVGISAGFCADRLVNAGVRTLLVRQAFQITGMLVPAACLAYCACTTSLEANQAAAAITLGSAVSAITVAAVSANHFDISPKNAGTIFGIGNTAGCIGGLIALPVSGYLFDQTNNWDAVFILFAAHYIGGALLWGMLVSDQPLVNAAKIPTDGESVI